LPQGESSDDLALEQLAAWERSGIRLRPRALFTTLYARLVLCDLFLHGIGGGKYDELTNELIARYFQLVPPTFVVATATMRLPLGFPEPQQIATPQDAQRGRALRFHGDQFLTTHPAAETKRALLAAIPPRGMRRAWHAALTQCNAMLASALSSQRAEHAAIAEQFREQQRVRQGLTSREFSFCLFPSVYLRTKLTELASG
jgi:hypothetical protein